MNRTPPAAPPTNPIAAGAILLYSDQVLGVSDAVDERLTSFLSGSRGRMGFIPSESDPKRRYFEEARAHYGNLGLTLDVVLELGADHHAATREPLFACDAIHLAGGSAEPFLANARKRELGPFLKRYLARGGLVVGVSAGAMILTPSLGLCEAFHEDGSPRDGNSGGKGNRRDRGGRGAPSRGNGKGLGLLPFEFYPHFDASTATSVALTDYARARGVDVYACHDSEGILVTAGILHLIGEVEAFRARAMGEPGAAFPRKEC